MVFRNDRAISQDVIDEVRARGPGVAQIIDLDGRRTLCQRAKPVVSRQPHEIDDDVDLVLLNEIGDLSIAPATNVDEMFDPRLDPVSHR